MLNVARAAKATAQGIINEEGDSWKRWNLFGQVDEADLPITPGFIPGAKKLWTNNHSNENATILSRLIQHRPTNRAADNEPGHLDYKEAREGYICTQRVRCRAKNKRCL